MSIKDKIIMCFSNLYKRKVRTLLTTVGVVVGTCAIIITVSLGVGMQQAQEEALSQMGDLTIINVNSYGISRAGSCGSFNPCLSIEQLGINQYYQR